MNEPQWTTKVYKLIRENSISYLKDIYPEPSCKKGAEYILRTYFNVTAPQFTAKPDLIMVFEDYIGKSKDYSLIAVELKYFQLSTHLDKNLRKASREIGQALRYYLSGFDSAILWHTFAEEIEDEIIISYSSLIGEVFEKLGFPLTYFSTKILFDNSFKVYKPMDVQGNLAWLIRYMYKVSQYRRNPLLNSKTKDQKIIERRRALKAALRVP